MTDNNLKITYKGEDIVDTDISTATTKTLKTSGKYCEGDITITAKGSAGGVNYAAWKANGTSITYNSVDLTGVFDNASSIDAYAMCYAFYKNSSAPSLQRATPYGNINFSNLTSVGNYALNYAFYNCTGNFTINGFDRLSSIGQYGFNYAFYNCSNLTGSLYFNSLQTMPNTYGFNYAFYGSGITSVEFDVLRSLNNYGLNYSFSGCKRLTNASFLELTNVNYNYAMNYAFNGCTSLRKISIPKIKDVNGSNCMSYFAYNCSNLEEVESNIETIGITSSFSYAFAGCTKLNVNQIISTIKTINAQSANNAFRSCTAMNGKQVIFKSLETIGYTTPAACLAYAFNSIPNFNIWFLKLYTIGKSGSNAGNALSYNFSITTTLGTSGEIYFPELTTTGNTLTSASTSCLFANNTYLRKIYMPKLSSTGTGGYWFSSNTNLSELHFGKENESAVRAFPQFSNRFGAPTGCTIYFDLINHITVNGTVYNRDGEHYIIDDVIANKANNRFSWKDSNGNIIYTKEAWTPTVGDSVYDSDDNVVGTISAVS